jgi:acetate kinase
VDANGVIAVLNCGSSSVKYALFASVEDGERLLSGAVEHIGTSDGRFWARGADGASLFDDARDVPDAEAALTLILDELDRLSPAGDVAAVGHRVVHGGPEHDTPTAVGAGLVDELRELVPLAPLHLPHNLAGIEAVARRRPHVPQYACFDTAFHHGLPRAAYLSGLPRELEREGIHKYGYHGLSYEHALEDIRRHEGEAAAHTRLIVAHLGNGASMAAIHQGRSMDTTMGFSPLDGLLMGTRCGNLDPGILLHLLMHKGVSPEALQTLLYERSGLLGVSGVSRNMQELLEREDLPAVADAIALFCYRVRYHLGGLAAALGGLDCLVFTGGMGARSATIRERICTGLGHFGITLDPARNGDGERVVSAPESAVTVLAFEADEEAVIARHVRRLRSINTTPR